LNFPNRDSYLLSSMWAMLSSSVLFLLIISIGFATTIYIIFRQKKLSDMKTDFINNMTHELKTPISTISLASEMLKNPDLAQNDALRDKYAGIIYDENQRLGNQVERVLQLAQLERGELKMNLTQVNVHDIINEAIKKTAFKIESRNGKINKHLTMKNPVIMADEVHLTNVIYNLLDNANKYSPESPEITISTKSDHAGMTISVEDKGIGMTREIQRRIFDKFYRLTEGNLHNVQGFGLGLSYVKLIVERLGGTITVSSQPGKGSCFEIFLPKSLKNEQS